MLPRIIGLKGSAVGLNVNLAAGETTLGREPGNSVTINSSSVSRKHARIVPVGDAFSIEDLGSANGVRVNGVRCVGPTILKNGDQIELGDAAFLFESPVGTTATVSTPSSQKRPEVGSVERAMPFSAPSRADGQPAGCNPFASLLGDLSGILPGIMRYLPWVLGALVLFCLVMMLISGIGSLARSMAQGLSTGGTPPPANGPPANGSPTAQNSPGGNAKITILSTRVVRVVGSDQSKTPTLLIKWRNDSDQPVAELDGTVSIHTADGKTDVYPKLKLYAGPPVAPGQTHEDTGIGDGTPIASDSDPSPQVVATEVK